MPTPDTLHHWLAAWNAHDLEAVLLQMHEAVLFQNWDGKIARGKRQLRRLWQPWFARRDFRFTATDIFLSANGEQAVLVWQLDWPSPEPAGRGRPETRHGVDIIRFQDGLVIEKRTYVQTAVTLAGKTTYLHLPPTHEL